MVGSETSNINVSPALNDKSGCDTKSVSPGPFNAKTVCPNTFCTVLTSYFAYVLILMVFVITPLCCAGVKYRLNTSK